MLQCRLLTPFGIALIVTLSRGLMTRTCKQGGENAKRSDETRSCVRRVEPCVGDGGCPKLATEADQDDRSFPAWWWHRFCGTAGRKVSIAAAWSDDLRREPWRCEWHHWPTGANEICSGWLYDRYYVRYAHDGQSFALQEFALSAAARFRPGSNGGTVCGNAGGASLRSSTQRGRADRAGEGEARQHELWHRRHREFQSSGDGTVLARDRSEIAARALQGHRSCGHGPDRRRCTNGVHPCSDPAAVR